MTFPNLVGLTVDVAHTTYTAAGFTGTGNASYGARPYTAKVVYQDVVAGSEQSAATNVNLVIASPSGNTVVWGT